MYLLPQTWNEDKNAKYLLMDDAPKDVKHRMTRFIGWLNRSGRKWYEPDLAQYRDYLLNEYEGRGGRHLAPSSVRVHLATIRGRYEQLIHDNTMLDVFEHHAVVFLRETGEDVSPANMKALVDRAIQRLENDIDPRRTRVQTVTKQDRADGEHIRLTSIQANALIGAPKLDTLRGLRNTAIIALMLCTGIREAELVNLDVLDLRQRLGGELALQVRRGKGCKQRLIPYGELSWVLAIVDTWLKSAQVEDGAVFRGLYKNGRVRPNRLTPQSVNLILNQYPIMVDGELRRVKPHDLRRTYARRLYESDVDLVSIRDNLGHSDTQTTLNYIGTMNVDSRKPPAIYSFDVSILESFDK